MEPDWVRGEIAVIGLARSGRAAAQLLARAGSDVYASDAGTSPELEQSADALRAEGVSVQLGRHDLARIGKASLIVASPGVPPNAPPIAAAREAGIPIVSEIEIGLRFMPELQYIAITGTNGKTTTTALTGHLLTAIGRRAATAGNIGTPLTELAQSSTPPEWIALEVSSFQLHDTPSIRPLVGMLTNLSANHLDRYDSVAEYYGDKAQLFRNASEHSVWVSNADDPAVQQMVAPVRGRQLRFTVGAGAADGYFDRSRNELVVLGRPLISRSELTLLGDHNVANALGAALAVMGADETHALPEARARMAQALRAFRALEHRIEPAGCYDGVEWINDSKSTNVASTLVALKGMHRPTVLLLGGRHKGEPYDALSAELKRTVKLVIAYGEAAPIVAQDLAGATAVERVDGSFEDVIARARAAAAAGDAVLLSPACSSYDMFDNYEQRGRTFKRLAAGQGGTEG